MSKPVHIRDPVHNFLLLRQDEMKLVGTPIFQRLRGIRQLALANLVYPGAVHTRFDHSLGVCHVAGLLAKQLDLDEHEERVVRLAALLHDLGHGPFSHISEDALERYADRSKLPSDQKKEKIHELVTGHMIGNDSEIVRLLGEDTCQTVCKLLVEGHGQRALRDLVSGPLDADKQDYLLRDSLFCGVPYGVFDIHQLHRSLVLEGPSDDQELMILPDGVHAVEQYVLAKYYLTSNVYRHQVRLITDQMIIRAIVLGIEQDGVVELHNLYAFDNSSTFVRNYAGWDDARFMLTFGGDDPPGQLSGDLIRRLRQRQLFKQVFTVRLQDFTASMARERLPDLSKRVNDQLRRSIEEGVADILSQHTGQEVHHRLVIVHAFDIKSVRTTARNDEGSVMVATSPEPRPFQEESPLFASISERYRDGYVEVYAPVSWESRAERRQLRNRVQQPIRELIDQRCEAFSTGG